jgi:hypothetical protein
MVRLSLPVSRKESNRIDRISAKRMFGSKATSA